MRKFHRAPALIFLLVATGSAQAPLGFRLNGDVAEARDTSPLMSPDSGTPPPAANDPSPRDDTFINSGPTDQAALSKVIDTIVANTAPLDLPNLFPPQSQETITSLTPFNIDPQPDPQPGSAPDLSPPGGGGPVVGATDIGGIPFDAPATGGPGDGKPSAPDAPGTPVPEPTGLWMVAGAMLALLRPRVKSV